jgi:hypothetical protein
MIIGVSGKIGSGKDTVGQIIQYLTTSAEALRVNPVYNQGFEYTLQYSKMKEGFPVHNSTWEIKKFAGKLKQIASMLTGATLEQLEDQDFKKLEIGPDWGMTYRELLQKLGTEAMRNGLHTNVWVNALMADYHLTPNKSMDELFNEHFLNNKSEIHYKLPNWIITDIRFPNEMDAVKAKGGITIRVNRTNRWNKPQDIEHTSETALDNHEFDFVIDNNGTISDLIDKVKEILTLNNII